MKNFFSSLFFDSDLVKQIKKENVNEGFLYNQLINGKITLKEFLAAV
jgi:hypothetical protein